MALTPPLLQDSDGPPRPEGAHPPVFSALRHSRVVSSTSEEEEALTEKFLKINCKYITDGKVSATLSSCPGGSRTPSDGPDPWYRATVDSLWFNMKALKSGALGVNNLYLI